MECLFCQTQRGLVPVIGGAIYENELVYASHYFYDTMPVYLGYLVVQTRRHAPTFADLTDCEARAVGLLVTRLSRALKACAGAERSYVVFFGEAVPHLHVLVTARYPGTPPEYWRSNIYAWPDAPKGGPQEILALCDRLRAYLAKKEIITMSNTPMKPRILALLHFSRQQEQQFVDGLSDAERDTVGTPDSWSAKDFLVNIMLWKQLQTQKLAAAVRGETPPVWRDMQVVHQINSQATARYQGYSFQEVQEEAERIFSALITQVESLSEEELADANRYDWQEGEPLWEETLGNGLWHPCSQVTAFYLQRGDKQSALQLQETLLAAVRRAELPPASLGVAIYNQACFYARNGWPEKALLQLPEALRLRPTLIEWSQHDSDFDAVRADPAFQAIFQDPSLTAKAPVSSLVSPQELYASSSTEQPPIVIDVRGPAEYAAGHVQGAINIPLGQLSRKLKQIPRDRPVVTYCNMHQRGESRGERAAALLREQGYQVQTIDGGYPAWKEASLPVVEASEG